jgi:hypothetical protein
MDFSYNYEMKSDYEILKKIDLELGFPGWVYIGRIEEVCE